MEEHLAETAQHWQAPEHAPRQAAVRRTLAAPNRFTEEALAFALNQQMRLATPEALRQWAPEAGAAPCTVAVLHADDTPLAGFQDLLAVLLAGHRYVGVLPEASPALLPAFAEDLRQRAPGLPVRFAMAEEALAEADVVIAEEGEEQLAEVAAQCDARGLPEERRLLRRPRYAAAVLDGRESDEERDGLAEDVLLFGGASGGVRLLYAPRNENPDAVLDAFARFRAVFPVHPDVPGALEMQRAFLAAGDQPHAYGEGLEFLMSKGAPVLQPPGHVRWAEYETLEAAGAWTEEHAAALSFVVARARVARQLPGAVPVRSFGTAHRLGLGEGPGDAAAFLAALS